MYRLEENNKQNNKIQKSRNHNTSLNNRTTKQNLTYKKNTMKSSMSSEEKDIDKQNNSSTKKINATQTHISLPKLLKTKRKVHYISLNKKLTSDLNYQINSTNKKIFGNFFDYKQSINLQEINDYMIYEKTKKSIAAHNKTGGKNSFDFRIPIVYKRMDHHYKKEDLIPFRTKPKINLMDVLYLHNRVLRKSMSQNNCQKYYLKNNLKLMKEKMKFKYINENFRLNLNK